MKRRLMPALLMGLVAMPSVAHAQRGMGPGRMGPAGRGDGGNPVAPLIEMRRQLNLSTRQLVQLDSIERTLLQNNRNLQEQLRARMDSMRPQRQDRAERPRREMTDSQRVQMRSQMRAQMEARMDSLRPLREQIARNDSTARARALAVLTDSQRVQVREWQAEQRGFRRGMSARRGPAPRQGFRGAPPAPRSRMMPGAPRGRGMQPMPRRRPPAEEIP